MLICRPLYQYLPNNRYDHIVSDIVMAFRPDIRETDILNSDSDSESDKVEPSSLPDMNMFSNSDEDEVVILLNTIIVEFYSDFVYLTY